MDGQSAYAIAALSKKAIGVRGVEFTGHGFSSSIFAALSSSCFALDGFFFSFLCSYVNNVLFRSMSINTSAPFMKRKTVGGVLLKNRKHDFQFEERSFVCVFPLRPAYNIKKL